MLIESLDSVVVGVVSVDAGSVEAVISKGAMVSELYVTGAVGVDDVDSSRLVVVVELDERVEVLELELELVGPTSSVVSALESQSFVFVLDLVASLGSSASAPMASASRITGEANFMV